MSAYNSAGNRDELISRVGPLGGMMPVFENDRCEVSTFMLDVEHDALQKIAICLNEQECRRAQALKRERDRHRFVASRAQLRRVLASKLDVSPSDIEFEYGRLGQPRLSHRMPKPGLRFSLSRSGNIAVIAVSTAREVGVDIEAVVSVPEADEIASLCFSRFEFASYTTLAPRDRLDGFLHRWTRLEAVSKALGRGLEQPLAWDEADWVFCRFVPKPGYIGSVAIRN